MFDSFDYSASKTKDSVLESLRCMKLNHIDLIQIHDVEFAPSLSYLLTETIPCLVELKRQGFVHSIGITGRCTVDVMQFDLLGIVIMPFYKY